MIIFLSILSFILFLCLVFIFIRFVDSGNQLKKTLQLLKTFKNRLEENYNLLIDHEKKLKECNELCSSCVSILSLSISKNIEAAKELTDYDLFYMNTLEDIQAVSDYLRELSQREIISTDPDVQNVRKAMDILSGIMLGYLNAKNQEKQEKE